MDEQFINRLVSVVPSERQLAWQRLEFTAFLHYGMNSFTGREWGDGADSRELFHPRFLDTDQWCRSLVAAGIRGCILTAKHHDGFCLWDSALTDYTSARAPCGRDIVAMLSASCEKYGLKLGVYLSPWDRNHPAYGQGKAYDDYFCAQLEELLTRYGDIYAVWLDGACGEGANGRVQRYDWERYYAVARRLQPGAVLCVCGPDVRWCGNEAGECRSEEWSVVPARLAQAEKVMEGSQQQDDAAFRRRKLSSRDRDLGSRQALAGEEDLIWYPAEVNTSIRPGWFYHPEEDEALLPLERLKELYLSSAGGNAMLLLNIPPHPDGYLARGDVRLLAELGDWLRAAFSHSLLETAALTASSAAPHRSIHSVAEDSDAFWQPLDSHGKPWIQADFPAPTTVGYVVLGEQIRLSQRVERFTVFARTEEGWRPVFEGSTVGYKKICPLGAVVTRGLRVVFHSSRKSPALRFWGAYPEAVD